MRPYLAILAARCRVLLQYRAAAAAGIATQLFWGFIRTAIFTAFYAASTAPQPMNLPEVITYVWLGQALFHLLPWRGDPESEDLVRRGGVAYELLRPLGLYSTWFARGLAVRVAPTALRALPIFLVSMPFFGLAPPASFASAALFLVSLILAALLAAAITVIVAAVQLWTISGRGAYALLAASAWIFSGMLLPVPLFPDWFRGVVEVLPFRGVMDTPLRLWSGHLAPADAPAALLHQAAWIGALVLAGRALLARGRRRLVVYGG